MSGKRSSGKGSAFERLVVEMVLKRFPQFSHEDCHRTPKSGGHPYESSSDLRLSPAMRKVFPYAVECKHQKGVRLDHVWPKPTALICGFLAQAERAAAAEGGTPIVVMRGNATPVYVAVPRSGAAGRLNPLLYSHICLHVERGGVQTADWVVMLFQDWLERLA